MQPSPGSSNNEVIARVEEVVEKIIDALCREEPISICLRYKVKPSSQCPDTSQQYRSRLHTFPGGTPREAWRFTALFRILGLIHEALSNNTVISKRSSPLNALFRICVASIAHRSSLLRNIYYKDPSLFKSQAFVDRYVDIFAYTFGIPRAALNVTAAARGLVAGSLVITRPDGTTVSKGLDGQPYLVDDPSQISTLTIPNITWILVVEKEASLSPTRIHSATDNKNCQSTFRTLASDLLHQTCLAGKGIILTAKGYPDISTRSFLRRLATPHSSPAQWFPPPIYALTDFDPDGLAIMSTYKHGSFNLSHENERLTVDAIEWLGVRSRDILDHPARRDSCDRDGSGVGADPAGLLRLSARDRKKAVKMLESSGVFEEGGGEEEWRREMQVMLMLNVKAEMEILAQREGGVRGWVEGRLVEVVGMQSQLLLYEQMLL